MNPYTKKTLGLLALASFLLFVALSCNKDDDNTSGTANFNVFLASSNSAYKASSYDTVNIDIQKVYVHTSSDSAATTGWFELETNHGVFDLLDYASGNDTLLAFDSVLQVQTISQVRLVLGNNNTVVKDGQQYDLSTPSGQTSGIKIQIHAKLEAEKSYKVVLDFDPDKSIIETGNGKFKLKPVIGSTVIEQ